MQFGQIAVDSDGEQIYWLAGGDAGALGSINVDGTNKRIIRDKIREPRCLALDVNQKKVYWAGADPNIDRGHTIRRANFDGTSEEDLVKGLYKPYQLSLDIDGGWMYYVDQGRIKRAHLDGSNEEILPFDLVRAQKGMPRLVAVDPLNSRLFWGTDLGIGCVALDGTGLRANLGFKSSGQCAIAIDSVHNQLYWVESSGSVCRAALDGRNLQLVTHSMGGGWSFLCIDSKRGKLDWVDDNQAKIVGADLPALPKTNSKPAPP